MKRVILTFEADEDLKKHLKEQAEKNKRTMSAYIRALLKRGSKYKEILVTILIFVSSCTAFAGPINPKDLSFGYIKGHETIILQAGPDLTIHEAFEKLDEVALWYMNKVVVKDGVKYFRYGITPFKKQTYILREGRHNTTKKRIKL